MKFSYFNTFVYHSPELAERGDGWPVPTSLYDTAIGLRTYRDGLAEVARADELGFDWISASEHHYWSASPTPNPAVLLGALSQVVRRAKLALMGPLVSMNNPIRVAEEVAMLDQMTGGRLVVLFLRGTPNEFLAYDVMPEETRARTQEAMTLIRRALQEREPFGWEGRHFRFRTVSVWPGPTQQPSPPIYASGNSVDSASWAARHGYAMGMAFYPPHLCAQLAEHYRDQCALHGWTPEPEQLLYRAYVAVGETDAEAEAARARFFGDKGGMMGATRKGRGSLVADQQNAPVAGPTRIGTDADGRNVDEAATKGFALGGLAFCGGPDTLVEQIERFRDATGVGVLDLGFNGGGLTHAEHLRALEIFGTRVMPRLRAATPTTHDPRTVRAAV